MRSTIFDSLVLRMGDSIFLRPPPLATPKGRADSDTLVLCCWNLPSMHPRDSNFVWYFENISRQTLCQRMPGGRGGGNGMSQYMTPDLRTLFAYQMKTNNHYKNSPFHPRYKLGHLLHDQKVIHIHSYEIKQQ